MIPLRDTNPRHSFPLVNYLIIAGNILIFLLQLISPNPESMINAYAFTPAGFSLLNVTSYAQVFTSMWLHGGFLHIIFNMWFLHIFGDNVEDALGHIRYLVFYLVTGVAAVGAQYVIAPSSVVPLIGASGAIAGVTGAYFFLFRNSRIVALVPSLFGLWHKIELPAWFFLGYWFVLQLISGFGSLAAVRINEGGVAFFAHIGGVAAGYVLAMFTRSARKEEDYMPMAKL